MDEKEKKIPESPKKDNPENSDRPHESQPSDEWVWDMKQELEDYIEDQGIYIRQ